MDISPAHHRIAKVDRGDSRDAPDLVIAEPEIAPLHGTSKVTAIGNIDGLRQWKGAAIHAPIGSGDAEVRVIRIGLEEVRQRAVARRIAGHPDSRQLRQAHEELVRGGNQLALLPSCQAHQVQCILLGVPRRLVALRDSVVADEPERGNDGRQHEQQQPRTQADGGSPHY